MQHLLGFHSPTSAPPVPAQSAPFSDWSARVQRILNRRFDGSTWSAVDTDSDFWQSLFDCGFCPVMAADAYIEDLQS